MSHANGRVRRATGPKNAMMRSLASKVFVRRLVDVDDEILLPKAGLRGGTVLDHLHDLDTEAPTECVGGTRWQWAASSGDAEVGAAEAAPAHEGGDDAAGSGVHRHGQAE